jgi:hypothetical protein
MEQRRLIAAVFAPLLLIFTAQTQAPVSSTVPPSVVDPNESVVVQELEVIGRRPGPALWTVKRGQATVIVMGGLSPLPHSLAWDAGRLERNMQGADVVLLPPTGRIGLFDAAYILLHTGDLKLGGGRKLHDVLSPDQRRRFDAIVAQAKSDPKRYEGLKPAIAAFVLDGDFIKAAGLSTAKPGSTVKRLADAHHIRTKAEGGIPVVDVFRAVAHMDEPANRACFDAVMSETEWVAAKGRLVADAWSTGDLHTVKALGRPEGMERCVAGAPGLQGFVEKLTRDATASLDQALNRGGKTIAVVDLQLLLRPNGVLDRLRGGGAEITVPME